jgi:hypothetical protein
METGHTSKSEPTPSRDSASAVYARRLRDLNRLQSADSRRDRQLGYAKLAVAALTLVASFVLLHYLRALEYLFVPVAGFAGLAVVHETLLRHMRLRARAIAFYERGQARLEYRWQGSGEQGDRFLDERHAYARDLDIFGAGSVFELLCTARTRAGEETLAAWLLAPAPADEVLSRQAAVRDLEARVGFREKLATLGETVRLGIHPSELAAWGEQAPIFEKMFTRIATRILALLWVASLIVWPVWGNGDMAGGVTLLNFSWAHRIYRRWEQAAGALEKAADGLTLLAGVLALLEQEVFQAPRLLALQQSLRRDGIPPSAAIRKLARLAAAIEQRENRLLKPFDLFTFWSAHLIFAAEGWQQEFGPAIRGWLQAVGELEALTALAAYAYEHPADVFPEFAAPGDAALFDAEAMAHPLLPAAKAVRNNLKLGYGLQVIILSGPNMAGKSTFIRSIGVNAVLAQAGAPVRATRLKLSPLTVAASICILDSLSGGVSRFYAEIHRLKLISDLSTGPMPVLFLLDELLSGTNSNDRLAGSEFIVRSLMEQHAIGMISTHDLALTRIPETVGDRAANYHFQDQFADGALLFDYKLKPGIVKTSNALQLMRSIGLGVDVQTPG